MVKEFDPLDATLIGDTEASAAHEVLDAEGLYAGRYQIEQAVGRGGMGTVYRAVDVMVGDVVALKILDATITGSGDQLEWFRREVRLARKITHPNVARTHDMGEQAGAHYITMEFIEGKTLQDILRPPHDDVTQAPTGPRARQALAPVTAVRIALAVCDGLAAAHAAGVVHRDLKPANILIEHTGRVVLTDFGIARGLADENAGTHTQGVVGTPLYMAPEQLAGTGVGFTADIYALGLILFEMLTGALPFAGETPIAAALARLTKPPPDPRNLRPDLPEPLVAVVLHALATLPDHRPQSASSLGEQLRQWLTAVGEPLTGPALMPGEGGSSNNMGSPPTGMLTPTQQQRTLSVSSGPLTYGHTRGTLATHLRPLRPLAPVLSAERALAVLPFRYIGPPDQGYLGDALTDELIDVLSRTRGLRVLGSGATSKYRNERDPRAVGADLGVEAIVDATVQATARQVRVAARLIEVASGTQLWSDRFESGLEDLFELQDRISKRIAEALRVELSTSDNASDVPAEAISLYLRGRRKLLAFHIVGTDGAIDQLEQAIALAPHLQPALACHALASLRAWFMPTSFSEDAGERRDWEQEARTSVARALDQAPDLAETHLAQAMLGVQLGEWREAVKALVRALEIAPTYAHAHQYLAQLQCEAGNTKEGLERAKLAYDLEPNLVVCLFDMARFHALRGNRDECDRLLELAGQNTRYRNPVAQFQLRVAAWFGDATKIRDIADGLQGEDGDGFGRYVINYARGMAGDLGLAELENLAETMLAGATNPRFHALMCQTCVEIFAVHGHYEQAFRYFQEAADRVLIDIEWTDRCPLVKPLRDLPGFVDARRKIRQRVQAMWSL